MSLVRAAWERRPEGPAYLLSSVMLLYLAGQCAFFCTHIPHLDQWNSEGFSRVPADGFFLFLNFQIQDLSSLASPAGSSEKESAVIEPSPFEIFSLQALGLESAAQAENFLSFWVWLVVRSRDRATPPTI